ncbi:MAG: PAS domain S-box protein, partial [Mariprofundus sp.]
MKACEDKFRAIFDASPEAIMLLDKNGFLDCNPATLKIFACNTNEEFLGRHPSSYSPKIQLDGRCSRLAADEEIAIAYEEGTNLFEWTHRRSNGEVFPAEVQLTRLNLNSGQILQATVRDISERKQAEEDLAYEKSLFGAMIESIPDAIVYTDINRIISSTNAACSSIFGFDPDELVGKTTSFLYESYEEYEIQGQRRFNLSAARQSIPYEVSYRKKDGTIFLGETLGTVVKDNSGNTLGFIGVIRDITKRKQAENTLRKLSQAIEQAGESIIITDKYGTIEYVNPSFTRITGYTSEEVIGQNPRILKSGNQSPEYYERLWSAISGGQVWQSSII